MILMMQTRGKKQWILPPIHSECLYFLPFFPIAWNEDRSTRWKVILKISEPNLLYFGQNCFRVVCFILLQYVFIKGSPA